MKHLTGFLAIVFAVMVTVMLLAPAASAQETLRVTIPFSFTINHRVLPAGSYTLTHHAVPWEPFLLLTDHSNGRVAAMLMVRMKGSDQTIDRSSLVFYSTGHKYWLTEVRFSYSHTASQVAVRPKQERTLAKNDQGSTVEIAAR